MKLTEYAETRNLDMTTALKILEREELARNLDGHLATSGSDASGDKMIILDDTAVDLIDEYIVFRPNERVRKMAAEQYKNSGEAKANSAKRKKWLIAALIALFVYYMAAFVLQIAGVIDKKIMSIMILPVAAGIIIFYLVVRANRSRM